jgi:Icc protein
MLMAQLSDTHLLADVGASVWGRNPAANVRAVMSALPSVDAIVVSGDVAEDGSTEAYQYADELIRQRAIARYFIAGNHDDDDAMSRVLGHVGGLRLVQLSPHWTLALVNSHWVGHDAGYVADGLLAELRDALDRVTSYVVLSVHHPPLSPCSQAECRLANSHQLLEVLGGSRVRVVLSGHVHQMFSTVADGITFLGAPSTLRQLRHGGDPHYVDTGESGDALVIDLHNDGSSDYRPVVTMS